MKIFIYPKDGTTNPSTCIDITPYITVNQNQQKRCDDAFAITTFKMIIPATLFSKAKYNIPPFTMFEIASSNIAPMQRGNERYFGYSKCTKYLREQPDGEMYYIHDVTLVEPLALLETIQIGTKTFTNHNDIYYLDVLTKLIHNITGFNIHFDIPTSGNNAWNSLDRHSYSYDKGTTAFEIANDIFTIHNCKMKIDFWDTITTSTNAYSIYFIIKPINLDSIREIQFNDNTLTYVSYEQNFDNYCKCLESQVDNVVDRNTITKYSNLTCRSDENNITADNCFIELPAKIESVENLKVYTNPNQRIWITISKSDLEALQAVGDYHDYYYWVTWRQIVAQCPWVVALIDTNNPNAKVTEHIYKCMNAVVSPDDSTPIGVLAYEVSDYTWFDITKLCLDSSIYMGLDPSVQPKYCYYSNGSNKIEGVYLYYKDDWIHQLIGVTTEPMLHYLGEDYSYLNYSDHSVAIDKDDNNVYGNIHYTVTSPADDNPMNVLFSVKAHPITNQYVKDIKDETNIVNENAYFNTSRSYGNSANYIDYDIMRKNIHISNSFLGTPELTIQTLDYCPLDTNTKFTYDNKVWYVSSIVMEILREHIMYTINASTNYNKQADSIGVRTQYQATKIALDNIKERHVYFRDESAIELYGGSSYYFDISFEFEDESVVGFYIPVSIYAGENGVTLVASTVDNYSIGKYYYSDPNISFTDSKYIQKDAKYCDDNGEVKSIYSLNLGRFDTPRGTALTLEASRKLPIPSADLPNFSIDATILSYGSSKGLIYKDEHESLVFTVYLPNATFEDE